MEAMRTSTATATATVVFLSFGVFNYAFSGLKSKASISTGIKEQ
jgi:hypothetical protein